MNCWNCTKEMKEKENLIFEGKVKDETFNISGKGFICDCGYKTLGAKNMDTFNIAVADAYREKHNLLTTSVLT